MLERSRLRAQVVALLKAANTDAGARVYDSRVSPNGKAKLPAINIYTLLQNGDGKGNNGAPEFDATLTLTVECIVAKADGWGLALDNLCEQVETALLCNPDFIKEFEAITSYSTTMRHEDGGENPVSKALMNLGLKYTEEFQPVIADDLGSVHIRVNAIEPADRNTHPDGGPDGRDEGVVLVENLNA